MRTIFTLIVILILPLQYTSAQVGIGVDEPQGALHIASNNTGFVFPKVSLTASNVAAPVINPQGGAIVPGTTVYNNNTTTTGTNDVYEGIYSWDGSEWRPQFILEDYEKFEQSGCQRTDLKADETDFDTINGLTNVTFTPKFSGKYKIKVSTNYAAGEITNFYADDEVSLGTSEGNFYFELSGPGVSIDPNPSGYSYDYRNGWIYLHAFSVYNERQNPDNTYENTAMYSSVVYVEDLTAEEDYTFTLSISVLDAATNNNLVNGGMSGDGLGYVGCELPCMVEFIYVGQ